jgi:hypothetical protein
MTCSFCQAIKEPSKFVLAGKHCFSVVGDGACGHDVRTVVGVELVDGGAT